MNEIFRPKTEIDVVMSFILILERLVQGHRVNKSPFCLPLVFHQFSLDFVNRLLLHLLF